MWVGLTLIWEFHNLAQLLLPDSVTLASHNPTCPCRCNTLYRHAYRPSLGPPAFPDIEKEVHYVRASSMHYRGAINIRYSHPTEKRLRPNFCGTLSFLYPIHFPMFSGKRSKNPFSASFLPFLSSCHFLRFLRYPRIQRFTKRLVRSWENYLPVLA